MISLLLVAQALFGASNVQPHKPFPPAWQATLDLFTGPDPSGTEPLVPGAVVIIKSPAFGVRVGTTGYADLATKRPIHPDQPFRVGSVTKSFTAQALLMLEQQGKLKLTDPITKYLGDNPIVMQIPSIQNMTIDEVLHMNSGIASYNNNPTIAFSPQKTPNKAYTPDELMEVLGQNYCPPLQPTFQPPTATYPNPYWLALNSQAQPPPPFPWWDYSNSNYILLGMVAEKITGKPFHNIVEDEIFKPLKLDDTIFAMDAAVPPDAIHGYTHYNAVVTERIYAKWHDITNINATYAWSAGAIISTLWDLLKYVDAIFQTNTFLNAGSQEKWLTFVSADVHWPGMEYGGGGLMQGHRVYGDLRGHGGAYPGYKTLMYYFYDSDTTIVLCTNTMDPSGSMSEPEVAILDSLMPLVKSAVTTPNPVINAKAPINKGNVQLAWQAGRVYGTNYDVYIGTDADKVDRATSTAHDSVTLLTTTANQLSVPALKPNTTYYWRVDTITAGQPLQITSSTPLTPFVQAIPPVVNGPVWSFKTTTRK
ncbi:MAG: serine hydrolase [Thermoanaerobaculia bacterium]